MQYFTLKSHRVTLVTDQERMMSDMASVNYMKAKTSQDVKRVIRHCDKEMRKADGHGNKNINLSVTDTNLQFGGSYKDVCDKYDERIKYLDSLPNANKRKDRVTCFFLEIPLPEAMMDDAKFTRKDRMRWCNRVNDIVREKYGSENVLCGYIHFDEQHEYKDAETKKNRLSRIHMHLACVPEHDDKLNGKWFSSRANMIKLNDMIQKMSTDEFNVEFMTGSKKKSLKSVEQLKNESQIREVMDELDEREIKIKRRENALDARESDLDRREQDLHDLEAKASETQNTALQTQMAAERIKKEYEDLLEKEKLQLKETLEHCGSIDAARNEQKRKAMQRAMDLGMDIKSPKPVKDIGMEI